MKKQLLVFILGGIMLSSGAVDLKPAAEQANRNLWSRFMSPDFVLYDYAGLKGEVLLPTPEECEKHIPNGLGWWTPVENGGFFNGMYLIAMCDRYKLDPSPENRDKVKKLVAGLYKLQDVGQTPGFIARGIGSDGKCHYVASSNDQVFPWFLGLWSYLRSDIPAEQERRECIGRMERLAGELEKNRWVIPGDIPDFNRGWWLGENFCAAVHIATVTRILYEVTKNERYLELHYRLLDETDRKGVVRKERIAAGMDDLAHWSAWFNSNAQYAVRELYLLEKDPARKALYLACLQANGRKAVPLLTLYRKYDPAATYAFTPDWHRMMPPWQEQRNDRDSQKLALEQLTVWNRACPAIDIEKGTLKPAVCAGYIVLLSETPELVEAGWPEIEKAILHFDYDKLHYSAFFYVENVLYHRFLELIPK